MYAGGVGTDCIPAKADSPSLLILGFIVKHPLTLAFFSVRLLKVLYTFLTLDFSFRSCDSLFNSCQTEAVLSCFSHSNLELKLCPHVCLISPIPL